MFTVPVPVAALVVTASAIAVGIRALLRRRARQRDAIDTQDVEKARQDERTQVALVHAERQSTLERIAAGVAHEVNNPAGFILAHLELIRGRLTTDDRTNLRDIDDCIDGVRRIRTIVSALHVLTRSDDAPTEPVRLAAVVESALQVGTPSIPEGVEITRQLAPAEPFESRPGTIMRIVLDLVANAADSIPAGERGRIVVSTRCEGDVAVIDVREDRKVASAMPENGARQLALEVVRQSLRSLGGALSLTPTDGGLVRTARIPMPPVRHREAGPALAAGPTRRGTVLLIDDERALIRVLSRVVGRVHDVVTALSGKDAEEVIRARGDSIDVIVCDVILADTNGPELRDRVAASVPALSDRFAFMTGGGLAPDLIERIHRAGCPILEKPLEPDQLLDFIATRLARSS